jgi:hypothetical protein
MPWWSYRRHVRNGRIEVACRRTDDHLYWLTPGELASWTVCAHCVGWISHWPAASVTRTLVADHAE